MPASSYATSGPDIPGPLALIGSGEYLREMADIESALIRGRSPRYAQIPTAAAAEGTKRLQYWIDLGIAQAERIGVEAVPVVLENRRDANDPAKTESIAGAGLIYLSGGRPDFLVATLEESLALTQVIAAWRHGAALAGCSAGAMAICDWVPGVGPLHGGARKGFGLIKGIGVLPHFDRLAGRIPDILRDAAIKPPNDISLLGIDEGTALIWESGTWRVEGKGSVWDLSQHPRKGFGVGMDLGEMNLPQP